MLLSASSLFDKKKKSRRITTKETITKTQYKQGQELWKCVKNDPNLKEKKMHELMLKAA